MKQSVKTAKINVKDLNLFYGEKQALFNVSLLLMKRKLLL